MSPEQLPSTPAPYPRSELDPHTLPFDAPSADGFSPAAPEVIHRPPAAYMTEKQLQRVCIEYNLSLPQNGWNSLRRPPVDRLLLVPTESRPPSETRTILDPYGVHAPQTPGITERLALGSVSSALRDMYAQPSMPNWPGVGNRMMYTLNTVSMHFNQAEAAALPEPPVAAAEHAPEAPIADPALVTQFAETMGIAVKPEVVQATLHRITQATAAHRYPVHLGLLTAGNYQVDGIAFQKRGDEITSNNVDMQALLGILNNQDILHAASVMPKIHYVLQRYGAALRLYGHIPAQHTAIASPPMHESMSVVSASTTLADEAFAERYASGEIYDYDAYGNTSPTKSLSGKVRRAEAAGIHYPLSALFSKYQPHSEQKVHYYLSKPRTSAFLRNVFAQEDALVEQTLLTAGDFAELCRINALDGHDESLPRAEVSESVFDDSEKLPAYYASHVESFAAKLGQTSFSSRNVYEAVTRYIGKQLQTDDPQWQPHETYIDNGRVYTLLEPIQPNVLPRIEVHSVTLDIARTALESVGAEMRPRDVYVLWQYFKAVRQQARVGATR